MSKLIKVLIISSVVAFIGTLCFAFITASEGVTYSPGISSTEMETLSYTELLKIKAEREKRMSPFDAMASNLVTPLFWIEFLKFWIAMVIVSLISHVLIRKFVYGK